MQRIDWLDRSWKDGGPYAGKHFLVLDVPERCQPALLTDQNRAADGRHGVLNDAYARRGKVLVSTMRPLKQTLASASPRRVFRLVLVV
jgi:hypothetical protein